jgi:hypothetical protein
MKMLHESTLWLNLLQHAAVASMRKAPAHGRLQDDFSHQCRIRSIQSMRSAYDAAKTGYIAYRASLQFDSNASYGSASLKIFVIAQFFMLQIM